MTSFFSVNYFDKLMNLFNRSSNDNTPPIYPRKTAPPRIPKKTSIAPSNFFTCMNCGNFIDEALIEMHSNKCTSISSEVQHINDNEVQASNFKLEKLKEHLTELFKTNKNYYLNVIIIYIDDLLLNSTQADSRGRIKKMLKNISSLTKTYKGSFNIQIYLDRFKVLLNNRLAIYRSQRNGERGSVSKLSSKSHDLEQISSISSINESVSVSSLNDMTNMSGSDQNDDTEASNKAKIPQSEVSQMNTKDMYREFSQKVLQIKFEKFNSNAFIRKIQCKPLFVECIKQEVPYADWVNFITKEMSSNCLKYIKHTRKINIKKMDTIHEEDF